MLYNYFNTVHFAQPWFFGLFLALPFLIYNYINNQKKHSSFISISSLKANGLSSLKSKLYHLPFVFRLLSLIFIVIALANPQTTNVENITEGDGIDIALCMDVSGSMSANDLKPNRLEAAKAVAIDFTNKRYTDRFAVVVFSGESFTQCPLTTDKSVVVSAIENLHCGFLSFGTAIGDGLATSVDRLRNSKTKSKIIILLTDGENNGGLIDPKFAKEIAKNFGIKVYTIGVGTDGITTQQVQTELGIVTKELVVSIDEKLLTEIATETGGKYFRAKDNDGLKTIYETIDELEKSKIESSSLIKHTDKFLPFAIAALVFLVIEILLRYLVFRKFP